MNFSKNKDLIIVRFNGGLGNQMFQYAFLKSLEKVHKNIFADLCSYNDKSVRPFILENVFDLKIIKTNLNCTKLNAYKKVNFLFRVLNKILIKSSDYRINKRYLFREDTLTNTLFYNPPCYYLSQRKGYFLGYWQSEEYFKDIKDSIIRTFKFKINHSLRLNKYIELIRATKNSVSLHWRLGDYVNDSTRNVLNFNYYYNALNYLRSKIEIKRIFIFSEDSEFVEKEILKMNINLDYLLVSKDLIEEPDYIEMYLMSLCEHNIIANSSFSWWGAYLNVNPDKIVLAPDKWVHGRSSQINERIPSNWIVVQTRETQ